MAPMAHNFPKHRLSLDGKLEVLSLTYLLGRLQAKGSETPLRKCLLSLLYAQHCATDTEAKGHEQGAAGGQDFGVVEGRSWNRALCRSV